MSAEVSLASRWQRCEDYYRDLGRLSTDNTSGTTTRFDDRIGVCEGMRTFVARIAPLAIAENIYPGNAHAWLFLTKGAMRSERSVYLLCDKHGSRFGIRWFKDGRPVMYTVKAMDSARWQRIVTWLTLQGKTDA